MRSGRAGIVVVALAVLAGCDATSGFADTADAALPSTKRYFDGRGQRLSEGPWNRVVVDLDSDTLYHVGARRLDDDTPTFHLFGLDAREGCEVAPNAGTWLMGKPEPAPYRVLPYLEDIDPDSGRGRLRFTTLDCEVQDTVIEDAGRPYPRLYDHGYLVPTKQGYTFVDPWAGTSLKVAENLQATLEWSKAVLFWADGKLKSFTEQFEAGDELGSNVVAAVSLEGKVLIEDDDGLSLVTLDRDSLELSATPVLKGACHLQRLPFAVMDQTAAFIALQQPCGSATPSVLRVDAETAEALEAYELPFEADPHYMRVTSLPLEGAPEQLSVAYLSDVDQRGRGTLWGWHLGLDQPLRLGEQAELNGVSMLSGDPWDGVVQTDLEDLGGFAAYDWSWFRWDGTFQLLGQRMVQSPDSNDVLVNFDGVAGDWARWKTAGELEVIASGVPAVSSGATSFTAPRRDARIDHFDGKVGRLLLSNDSEDIADWDELGSAVSPSSVRFSWFMPALLYLDDWDAETGTGSLVAYNYELEARSVIADGVSSLDLTSYPWDALIYAVPYGKDRGVWLSKAK